MVQQEIVCKNCGYIGIPKRVLPGHGLIELILWLCYIVPGLIYTIWRKSSAYDSCPICNSRDLVPSASPIGREHVAKIRAGNGSNIQSGAFSQQKIYQQQESKQDAKKKGNKVVFLLFFVGLPFLVIILSVSGNSNTVSTQQVVSTTPTNGTGGNIANTRLLALPEKEQAVMLGKLIGEGCTGKKAFYMGIGKRGISKNYAFWSISCTNGKSYEIDISPDAAGSSRILECPMLKLLHAGECFKKFADQ